MEDTRDARTHAAQNWYGYGRWDAPYWFVGMEPGGQDEPIWYETWMGLGSSELSDCRAHHIGSKYFKWHGSTRPPTQSTWRRLIALLLSYEGLPTDLSSVSNYQRDQWGSVTGSTALPEVSAIRAQSQAAAVDRLFHREHRINVINARFNANKPTFAVFYGVQYRLIYEQIIGNRFDSDGFAWSGTTLCVLVHHPAGRSIPAEMRAAAWWTNKGREMRVKVDRQSPCVSAQLNRGYAPIAPSVTASLPPDTIKDLGMVKNRNKAVLHQSCTIRLLVEGNPKLVRSKSYRRFDCYSDGMTFVEYECEVRRLYGDVESRKCSQDLKWDTEHKFIRLE